MWPGSLTHRLSSLPLEARPSKIDGVQDIVAIPAERIKPSVKAGVHATSAPIIQEDQSVVPLLNWRIFLAGHNPTGEINMKSLIDPVFAYLKCLTPSASLADENDRHEIALA
jgi:hypothetical protein